MTRCWKHILERNKGTCPRCGGSNIRSGLIPKVEGKSRSGDYRWITYNLVCVDCLQEFGYRVPERDKYRQPTRL
jgi:hypothetical protein